MKNVSTKALLGLALGSLLIIGAGCNGTAQTDTGAPAPGPRTGTQTRDNANQPDYQPNPPGTDAGSGAGASIDINAGATAGDPAPSGDVKEFKVTAKNWEFDPGTITVKQGDKVRLIVTSTDVAHGLAIPAFNVNVRVEGGDTQTVEFTADQKGTFPFFCSVFCGEGHRGMRGQLVVE